MCRQHTISSGQQVPRRHHLRFPVVALLGGEGCWLGATRLGRFVPTTRPSVHRAIGAATRVRHARLTPSTGPSCAAVPVLAPTGAPGCALREPFSAVPSVAPTARPVMEATLSRATASMTTKRRSSRSPRRLGPLPSFRTSQPAQECPVQVALRLRVPRVGVRHHRQVSTTTKAGAYP